MFLAAILMLRRTPPGGVKQMAGPGMSIEPKNVNSSSYFGFEQAPAAPAAAS